MTEPQIWVLIGVFAAALIGVITIVMTSFQRQLDAKVEMLSIKIGEGFARVETKLDAHDRDIAMLVRHVTGGRPES